MLTKLLWERLIIALDLDDKRRIEKIIETLSPKKVKFKVGLIAFTKFGPLFVKKLIKKNIDIFLDLKLYDIPNTMKETSKIITDMGCWAFTVHMKADKEALEITKNEVEIFSKIKKIPKPLILGVTELTSDSVKLKNVINLAQKAYLIGLDGVIASAKEARIIKEKFHNRLKIITPGIRKPTDKLQDQKRVTSAKEAFKNGADYIVVGRPIIEEKDYLKAAENILKF